jgi:hypothetical protein
MTTADAAAHGREALTIALSLPQQTAPSLTAKSRPEPIPTKLLTPWPRVGSASPMRPRWLIPRATTTRLRRPRGSAS